MPIPDIRSLPIRNVGKRNAHEFISKSKKFLYFEEICRKLFKENFLHRSKRPVRAPEQRR